MACRKRCAVELGKGLQSPFPTRCYTHDMLNRIDLKYTAVGLTIAAIISALISTVSDLLFWASFIIVVVAMMLNGILAEYEDNLPGGFNNPMSEDKIKIETERRKRKLLPIRIGIWVVFIAILSAFAWLYWKKGV